MRRFVDEGVLVSAKNFLFGSEPIVERRAGLVAALKVEFEIDPTKTHHQKDSLRNGDAETFLDS